MARHNLVFLLGFVSMIQISESKSGEPYAMAYLTVARAERYVGDNKQHMKLDNPLIMSRDPAMVEIMSGWEENDIIEVKGTLAARAVVKGSYCSHCTARNSADGSMVYVNPIYVEKRAHLDTQDECVEFLTEHREVSNQVFAIGRLCREPKKLTPKQGLVITQYQIALNRKYRIKQDPPEQKSDYPWVKSYGENAIQDRLYLRVGAEVFIDGCLQARKVRRSTECVECGQRYAWIDRALEIVPFETEYLSGHMTEEEVKEQQEQKLEELRLKGLAALVRSKDPLMPDDDRLTDEDLAAGMDSEEIDNL